MPSAGFLVISFIATILVAIPSAVFFIYGWRSSKLGRAFSLLAVTLFAVLAWATFTDPETPDFESKAVTLYGVWCFILYLGTAIYVGIRAVAHFIKRRHI